MSGLLFSFNQADSNSDLVLGSLLSPDAYAKRDCGNAVKSGSLLDWARTFEFVTLINKKCCSSSLLPLISGAVLSTLESQLIGWDAE